MSFFFLWNLSFLCNYLFYLKVVHILFLKFFTNSMIVYTIYINKNTFVQNLLIYCSSLSVFDKKFLPYM